MFWFAYYLLRGTHSLVLWGTIVTCGLWPVLMELKLDIDYGIAGNDLGLATLSTLWVVGALVLPALVYALFKPAWYGLKYLALEPRTFRRRLALGDLRGASATLGEFGPFVLYLRSFANERTHLLLGAANFPLNPFDLELHEALALRLSRNTALVGLRSTDGRKLQGVVEYTTTHEQWRGDVQRLWAAARFVVVVPGESPGVLEEVLAATRDGARAEKAIFVMPPRGGNPLNEAIWDLTVRRAQDIGIRLPGYRSSGLLFTLKGREVEWRRPMRLGDEIKRLANEMGAAC